MTAELKYLALVAIFTALMWLPYALNVIMVRGVVDALGYPDNPQPLAPWAARMKAAHYNAVENLVVFAVLVLVAHEANISNEATIMASSVYFWARMLHFASYACAVPVARTLAFIVGVVCQLAIAWQILA
jgi:uncharacterized MAPEG superfamily protein